MSASSSLPENTLNNSFLLSQRLHCSQLSSQTRREILTREKHTKNRAQLLNWSAPRFWQREARGCLWEKGNDFIAVRHSSDGAFPGRAVNCASLGERPGCRTAPETISRNWSLPSHTPAPAARPFSGGSNTLFNGCVLMTVFICVLSKIHKKARRS